MGWYFVGWYFVGGYFVGGYFVGGYCGLVFLGGYFMGGFFWIVIWIEKENKYFVMFDWHFCLGRGAEDTEEVFTLQKM